MKKIFFVLIAITTLFISCSNATEATSSNSSSNSSSSAGTVSSFTGGWYKLTQGSQITYLYYAANKYVTRAGNSSSEYSGTQLNTFKSDSFYYDTVAANYNLTRVTSNYPSWCGVNVNAGGNGGNGGNGGGSGSGGGNSGSGNTSSTIAEGWYQVATSYQGNVLYYIYYKSDKSIEKAKGNQGENLLWEALNSVKNNPQYAYDTVRANSSYTVTRINESEIPVFPQS